MWVHVVECVIRVVDVEHCYVLILYFYLVFCVWWKVVYCFDDVFGYCL